MENKLYNKFFVCIILLCVSVLLNGCLVAKLFLADEEEEKLLISNSFEKSDISKSLDKINLDDVNNLMIVAHPDDEILWGGGHLIEDNYLVVCVTCGTREKRVVEFSEAMYQTRDSYINLSYPDRSNKTIDNWNNFENDIIRDLGEIINYKDWDIIVTHNPDGEYGHIHHKLLNRYVTSLSVTKNLFYFGKYYEEDEIDDVDKENWFKLSNDTYKEKEKVEKVYVSQKVAISLYKHIDVYENWVSALEWENDLSV